jgi:hypothetical protein
MQAPAFRMVNAFQKRGVHADSFSPYIVSDTSLIGDARGEYTRLFCGYPDEVPLRAGLRDGGLRKGQDKDVFRQDPFLLHAGWS